MAPDPTAVVTATETGSAGGTCRFCGTGLRHTFVDLGMSPLCESYLAAEELNRMEPFYPLHAFVCAACFLVQLQEYVKPEDIFTEYAYFSSYSTAWLAHARDYVEAAADRLGLGRQSLVVELASNDGYLLQYFVEREVPVLGIEPARNVARVAEEKGVATRTEFFGEEYARSMVSEGLHADLIVANNVLAQVPDLNDFVAGMKVLLAPNGTVTVEFPHLQRLVEENQFDTIYHEHFSYFSLSTAERIFAAHGLAVYDVEELWSHGGSLRLWIGHADGGRAIGARVAELRGREHGLGYDSLDVYEEFAEKVRETKRKLLEFLIAARREGKVVVGYGAPGKGNTLLNYCGIRTDFVDFTVDRNPYKHGRFTPGTHIPIHPTERLDEVRPDYVLILPWNLTDEIVTQLEHIRSWGGQFVVPIPEVRVL